MHTKTNYLAVFGLLLACFLVSFTLNSDSVSAVSASITTNNNITLNASTANDGVSIDEESISVTTTCDKGYNLTIATSTSTNLYLNGDSTSTAAYTAVDGTSALNSSNNTNKWGYTITSNPTSSTIFSPLSTTASSIRTIAQTTSLTSETIPIYYGIKTDNTIDPGTYSMGNNGVITYYLTMNPLCYIVDIAYDGNNADAGTMGAAGTGVIHTGVKDGDTVSLIASNFSKDGYGFAGWSLDPDAGTKLLDNDNTNNPIVYGPQETITLPEGFADNDTDNDGIVKLYAVWLQSQGNLQGWMGCSSLDTTTYDSSTGALDLTKNSVTALTDQRDNDTYAIAKLADGNCWMIENLRLDAEASRGNNQYDPTVTNEWLAQGYGKSTTYGNFGGLADAESSNFSNSTTANSLYYSGTQSGTASINIGTSNYPGYRMPRYNNFNTSTRASNPTDNSGNMYSYGNYYTWHAAIADLTYNDTNNQSTTGTSLCPAGWHLPKGGDKSNEANNELWSLVVDGINGGTKPANYDSSTTPYYNGTPEGSNASKKLRAYPNNFLYSGYFGTSSAYSRGSYGNYWSSTALSYDYSYILRLSSSSVYPGANNMNKYNGRSIRCIASDPVTYTLTYDANGGSDVPSSQSTTANGPATFTLSNATPTRSGYTFAGWTDDKGNEVQPNGTFTTKDPNATLYAIWTNNSCNPTATTIGTGNTITDAVCLQDVTPSMKASLPIADATTGTYILIDARDNQSYTVAKLPDGELWMTKNLNYSSTNANTKYDTDIPSGTFRLPESTTTSNTDNTTATIRTTNNSGNNDNGTYYSWPAAIASTASYASGNITSSICPKGWDLPVSSQYTNLKTKADYKTGNLTTSAPSSFLINGGFTNGATFYQTSYSHFWTGTSSNDSAAYGARVNGTTMTTSSSTGTTYGGNKYYRKNIRCIASNGTVTINYDGNGTTEYPVTGSVASQTDVEVNITNTKVNGFTRANWVFNGWNTQADGSGTAIAANTAITNLSPTPGSTITLYAQWLPQYTITYVNNCMTYASANTACTNNVSNTTDSSQKINLTNNPSTGTETGTLAAYNKWTLTGWKIKGWSTVADNSDNSNPEYGVSATYTVPSGSDAGAGITLYAHWVPIYTVQYDGNGSDNDSTGMGSTDATTGIKTVAHTNVAEGDTFDLFASNFKRAGYGFVGWSTDSDAWNKLIDNDTTNDAKIWGPNEIITAPAYNGTPITTLYAIWAPAEKTDPSNPSSTPVYLQGWTGCSAMTATTYDTTTGKLAVAKNSITALTDERDGNVYTIAKLADENCWMVENLRLDNTPELSTTNTNINSTNSTLPITNVYNADSSLATKSNYLSATSSSWCTTQSNACYDQSLLNTTNTTANITPSQTQSITSANAHTNFNNTIYSYGNYYNWYSATAGYGTYSRSTSEPTAGDLCPAGWKLPYGNTGTSGTTNIGGTKGGFSYLDKQMGGTGAYQGTSVASNKWRMFPNNFVYSGVWIGSSAGSRGSNGGYWSASADGSVYAYGLSFISTYVSPGRDSGSRYGGFTVRCVAGS